MPPPMPLLPMLATPAPLRHYAVFAMMPFSSCRFSPCLPLMLPHDYFRCCHADTIAFTDTLIRAIRHYFTPVADTLLIAEAEDIAAADAYFAMPYCR